MSPYGGLVQTIPSKFEKWLLVQLISKSSSTLIRLTFQWRAGCYPCPPIPPSGSTLVIKWEKSQ